VLVTYLSSTRGTCIRKFLSECATSLSTEYSEYMFENPYAIDLENVRRYIPGIFRKYKEVCFAKCLDSTCLAYIFTHFY